MVSPGGSHLSFTILLLALAAQAPDSEPITVTGNRWAPFISPMGEPFRPRSNEDDTLGRWFQQADADANGLLTPSEMLADAERFFALLDTDEDGAILPGELISYEWEIAPEIQVNSRKRRARGEAASSNSGRTDAPGAGRQLGGYDPRALQGAARYALLNMPQPVAAADSNFDRAVTLDEFRRAAEQRFKLLDRGGSNQLTLIGLQALLPAPKERRAKGKRDPRIGTPVPLGD